jgi:hypothetical protein
MHRPEVELLFGQSRLGIVRCDVVGIAKHGIQADTPHGDTVLNKNYFLGFSR